MNEGGYKDEINIDAKGFVSNLKICATLALRIKFKTLMHTIFAQVIPKVIHHKKEGTRNEVYSTYHTVIVFINRM